MVPYRYRVTLGDYCDERGVAADQPDLYTVFAVLGGCDVPLLTVEALIPLPDSQYAQIKAETFAAVDRHLNLYLRPLVEPTAPLPASLSLRYEDHG